MKVLVADDQEDARMILRKGLEASGYTVATACNGQEALQMGRADPPDILITDIMMPVMDGYSLCRAWKADVRLNNIPVVFYTATYTDREDKKFAFDLGADAFIAKPTGMDYLIAQLNQIITARAAGKLAARWETPLPETTLLREYNQVLVHKLERKLEQLQQAELELKRSNRALGALSRVNHCLVHATDEQELLSSVCQAVVSHGGYRMAWVGYLEQDEARTIRAVAKDGFEEGYLESAAIVWADNERGRGPSGMAARTGQTQIAQDFLKDERMALWRAAAAERGYASSISLPLIDRANVFGVMTIYSGDADAFNAEEVVLLEEMSGDLAFGVRNLRISKERDIAQQQVLSHLIKLEDNLEETIKAIAAMVELRDPYTAGHERRMAGLAVAIAKEMGLPEEQVHGIHLAGEVHDLGKITIPAEILSKPTRLNELEYSLIKTHPQSGYDILKNIDFSWPIAQMVYQHHEHIDGSGYPQGLKGESIILEARILCVADVVEAMSSHRPYRPGLGIDSALGEIKRGRATIYDPAVVDACLRIFAENRFKLSES